MLFGLVGVARTLELYCRFEGLMASGEPWGDGESAIFTRFLLLYRL